MASAVSSVIRLEPVVRERMADLETPVSAFAKLRPLGGAFLLESAEGGERMGRYSFIGVAPRELVVSRDGDPLDALRRAMAKYDRPGGGPGLPRFSGGAVGYVGYEAARHFERIPLAPRDPHALPDAVFGIYDTVVAFDHLRHTM
ncbi:MAG TPA: anthranilate synthase component I, partial [Candidatus Limnocylindria bacterium]